MKKTNFWRLALLMMLSVFAFASCSDDDTENGGGIPEISFNDGGTSLSLAAELTGGETAPVKITSNTKWVLTFATPADESWCTPSQKSGNKGETNLTFNLSAATSDRQTVVNITATGSVEGIPITKVGTITIKQNVGGSVVPTTNVKAIRDLLVAMNPTEDKVDVTAELAAMSLTGLVTSDAAGDNMGNAYLVAVQDGTPAMGSGLTLNHTSFKDLALVPGKVITISLAGAQVGTYGSVVQLSFDAGQTVNVTDGATPEPMTISAGDMLKYESMLVKIAEVQPQTGVAGQTWNNDTNKGNSNFESKDGATFIVRTGQYAAFKGETIPDKSGPMVGIASQWNGAGQLLPRNASDIAGLTNDRFEVEIAFTAGTVAEAIAAGADKGRKIEAEVVATHTQAILIGDASGVMLAYIGAAHEWEAGDKVTVQGMTQQRYGVIQFTNTNLSITEGGNGSAFVQPAAVAIDGADVDAYVATAMANEAEYKYVTYNGAFSVSGNYMNVAIAGTETQGSIQYGKEEWKDLAGEMVTVTGWLQGASSSWLQTLGVEIGATTAPYITAEPTKLDFAAAGESKAVTIESGNLTAAIATEITGAGAGQFSATIDGNTVTVKAVANAVESAQEATLRIYAGEAEATVALSQMAKGDNSVTFDFSTFSLTEEATISSSVTSGGITAAFAQGGHSSLAPRYWSDQTVRMYNGNTMTLSGATITKVEFDFKQSGAVTANTGAYADGVWSGSTDQLVLTAGASIYFYSIKVTFADGGGTTPTTPTITAASEMTFVAAGEGKNIAYTAANLGSNNVYAKVEGTNADQFTLGTPANGSITVTAAANTEAMAKTATLTIYAAASEGAAAVASATVTLTQAAAAGSATGTIAETIAAGKDQNVTVEATVAATHTQGILIGDASGVMLVFIGAAHEWVVGDKVTVEGTTEERNGVIQIGKSDLTISEGGNGSAFVQPAAEAIDGAGVDAYIATASAKTAAYKYVTYEGAFSVSGNYMNVVIAGTNTKGSISYGKEEWKDLAGKTVSVTGWLLGGSSSWLQTLGVEVVESTTPYISIDEDALSFTAAGEDKTATISTNVDALSTEITGAGAAQFSASITGTTLTVTAAENTVEEAKEATLRVYSGSTEFNVALTQEAAAAAGTGTASFNFTEMGYATGTDLTEQNISNNGISLVFAQGTHPSNAPKYYTSDETARMYATNAGGNTLTVSGATITEIVLTGSSLANLSADSGTITDGTWTGSATSVVFTATAAAKLKTVKVTYSSGGSGSSKVYAPVTTAPADWSGNYVLVGRPEGTIVVANNNKEQNQFIGLITISESAFSGNNLTYNADYKTFAFAKIGDTDFYTIKMGEEFIGHDSNIVLKFTTNAADTSDNSYQWSLTMEDGRVKIVSKSDTQRVFSASTIRFATYTSDAGAAVTSPYFYTLQE